MRAHVPLRVSPRGEVLVVEPAHDRREVQPRELRLAHLTVAGHEDGDRPAVDVEQDVLQRPLGGDAELLGHEIDRCGTGCVHLHHRLRGLCGGLRRARRRRLGVGDVVAVAAPHEQVLAHLGDRHELVVDVAADAAGVGLDDDVVERAPIEDPLVGLVHDPVGLAQALLVTIEGVRVLHQELPPAEQAEPGALLVAVLPFDLVQVQRQVAVRGVLGRHERGDDLLLGGAEHHLAAVSVLELEDLVAVALPPPGLLPGLGRQHDRHPDLLRARRVHLLAHDRLDLAHRAHAERQRGVHAGRELAHEGRPQEQAVRGDLGLGRIVAERGREQVGQAHQGPEDTDARCASPAPGVDADGLDWPESAPMDARGMTWVWRRAR